MKLTKRYLKELINEVIVNESKNLIGKKAIIISDNDNYDAYRGKTLRITNVTHSSKEDPGYDDSMKPQALCDFETMNGKPVPFSLYEYEFRLV